MRNFSYSKGDTGTVKTNCNIGWNKYFRTNQKRALKLWPKRPKLAKRTSLQHDQINK